MQVYLEHMRLGRQAVRQVLQLRHAVRQPHWQLVVEELGGQDELALNRLRPKVKPAACPARGWQRR